MKQTDSVTHFAQTSLPNPEDASEASSPEKSAISPLTASKHQLPRFLSIPSSEIPAIWKTLDLYENQLGEELSCQSSVPLQDCLPLPLSLLQAVYESCSSAGRPDSKSCPKLKNFSRLENQTDFEQSAFSQAWKIVCTPQALASLQKLWEEPALRKPLTSAIRQLQADPLQGPLHADKLKGAFAGFYRIQAADHLDLYYRFSKVLSSSYSSSLQGTVKLLAVS